MVRAVDTRPDTPESPVQTKFTRQNRTTTTAPLDQHERHACNSLERIHERAPPAAPRQRSLESVARRAPERAAEPARGPHGGTHVEPARQRRDLPVGRTDECADARVQRAADLWRPRGRGPYGV